MSNILNSVSISYSESGLPITKHSSANLTVAGEDMILTKTVTPTACKVNDVVTYTITISNRSSTAIGATTVRDTLNPRLEIVTGTLKVDGKVVAGSITDGIQIKSIAGSATVIVEYKCKVLPLPIQQ